MDSWLSQVKWKPSPLEFELGSPILFFYNNNYTKHAFLNMNTDIWRKQKLEIWEIG